MPGILIFGGTTEGRQEALRLKEQGREVTVSVTSRYAQKLLPCDMPCQVGALGREEMLAFIRRLEPALVMDATHPYAVTASQNISACCRELSIPYERIERLAVGRVARARYGFCRRGDPPDGWPRTAHHRQPYAEGVYAPGWV